MTMTWSRIPCFSRALMFALNIGMVVVKTAEKPTMSGWCSLIASMNFSGATCTPRSMTSKPAPSNMMLTRFLPMSCTSPLTVPMTILPIVSAPVSASSGRSISSAPAMALPAISISGTKKSPRSNLAPTSSSAGISASDSSAPGPTPSGRPPLGNASHCGVVPATREAVELFRKAGQQIVDDDVVRLDPDFVLEQVAKAPAEFDVQARNPANNVHIGGDQMVFSGVYGSPFVREGDVRRDAMMSDFRRLCMLAQSFPQLDSAGGVICEPNDAPLDSRHLDMIYALQTLTDKFYMGNVVSGPNAADTITMSEILFGGRAAIERTPASISLINCNSPLRRDDRMLDAQFEYCAANQPVLLTPFLLMGAMSPVTIPAALVKQLAEALAGIAR